MDEEKNDIELYGDPAIASRHAPIPRWLLCAYILIPVWGIFCFALFWNGSRENAWFSHNHWPKLQAAANTVLDK